MYSTDAPAALVRTSPRPVTRGKLGVLLASDWLLVAVVFLLTRTIALLGAYSGVRGLVLSEPQRNKGWIAELALMWDAAWYAGIARDSYSYDPNAPGGTNVAFAPLYPFLMRAVATLLEWLTLGWDWGNKMYGSLIAAGLLISNISFYVALVLLMRLLAPRLGRSGAGLVIFGLAALPLSFFFSAIYTEGLFLLLVVGAFSLARSDWRHKWLCAALVGILASLCKFTGLLLLPVLAVEYLSQAGWQWRRLRPDILWLGLVPFGTGIFAVYLWARFGTPIVLYTSMVKGWNHRASFFLLTYWQSVVQLWQSVTGAVPHESDPVFYYGEGSRLYKVFDLAMPPVLLAGGLLARARVKPSEWAWLVLGIVYPLSTNITFSLARYTLPLWPGLLWLAIPHRRVRLAGAVWLVGSLVLLAWCSSIYGSAHWIG
ncbi:MAG TPA: hypothetical protein VM409_06180 [Chloroflexia bacterium]|nr:hypothetical protein [Chloroflexia bacterium]